MASGRGGADRLQEALPALRIGLVHGQQRADDRDATMQAFAAGELDVLVATTVIEVGIDVPNASVMLDRGRRTLRPGAAAPAARPGRPRAASVVLHPALGCRR